MKNIDFQSGNNKVIALVVLAVLAIVGLTVYSVKGKKEAMNSSNPAVVADAKQAQGEEAAGGENPVIEAGNPVVAKVNGKDIDRLKVFNFIQTLPPESRQLPVDKLFPAALEQIISAEIIESKVKDVNLDSDPAVRAQLAEAKKNIVRNVYLQTEVENRLTDERVAQAYEQYKTNFPTDITEVRARHILVDNEATAKEMIKSLDDGAAFDELAKANSIDGTAQNGGLVGYFAETEVVPEFASAAFAQEIGKYSTKPVKTQFGYHVIKVEEKRQRPPAELEQIKPLIEAQLRQIILNEVLTQWRSAASIQRFDINGNPVAAVAPAAGDEDAVPAAPATVAPEEADAPAPVEPAPEEQGAQ